MRILPADMNWCVVADMDGTLTNCDHRRHYVEKPSPDWMAFYGGMARDGINAEVGVAYNALVSAIGAGVVCTGRPSNYRKQTEDWLDRASISRSHLLMRKERDFRSDVIVKAELLTHIRQVLKLEPYVAFDDRDSVVAMWRENGVPCFQVAAGNF